mmetsp:Transcript_5230/g.14804  ORF Transcript_5230/g.14804 Transcript_5230/m.14804 type:complete len:451 (-) Transcript_5230:10-1362(-)
MVAAKKLPAVSDPRTLKAKTCHAFNFNIKFEDLGDIGQSNASTAAPSPDDREQPPLQSLCYGEQLIEEMNLRYKQRAIDRQRLEQLSMPRRAGANIRTWRIPRSAASEGCDSDELFERRALRSSRREEQEEPRSKSAHAPRLQKEEVDALCERLAKPRRNVRQQASEVGLAALQPKYGEPKPPALSAGELEVLKAKDQERSKVAGFDLNSMVERLSAPRVPMPRAPSSGEEQMRESRGQVDFERIDALARPVKRGASCTSWGCRRAPRRHSLFELEDEPPEETLDDQEYGGLPPVPYFDSERRLARIMDGSLLSSPANSREIRRSPPRECDGELAELDAGAEAQRNREILARILAECEDVGLPEDDLSDAERDVQGLSPRKCVPSPPPRLRHPLAPSSLAKGRPRQPLLPSAPPRTRRRPVANCLAQSVLAERRRLEAQQRPDHHESLSD